MSHSGGCSGLAALVPIRGQSKIVEEAACIGHGHVAGLVQQLHTNSCSPLLAWMFGKEQLPALSLTIPR